MTGKFWLDWAMLSVSLFNALLLLWLGLTVFLNAERRVWGIWLSSGGILLGAIFFTSHSAILGQGVNMITPGLNFWWRLGWIPVAALPFMWYIAILWYAGYWDHSHGQTAGRGELYRRQSGWFALAVLSGLVLIGLLGFANPLPTLDDLANARLADAPAIAGIPALIVAYPLYTLLCMGLSIDALHQPETSKRLMGKLARARARRWLLATSVVLLGVSLLVGWVMVWIVNNAWRGIFQTRLIVTVGWFDLVIAGLIAVSVLLLGQAVVSYEVFTGKTLPRRGLAQYWRRAVILSAGFSLLASGSLTMGLRPIYTLLLSAVVMLTFFALLGWRAFAERERLIENLRPFAAGQKSFESLLKDDTSAGHVLDDGIYAPFRALCVNVLETERAGLFPYGPLALLAGEALFYPPESAFSPPDLNEIAASLDETSEVGLALNPAEAGGTIFAVPLWRSRGLSGVILLGQKPGGGPYTQEEIEIAQATGEGLIDARASAEIARRLISLQRQRLVVSQVVDQRVRRKVHDEILPQVHTTILELVGGGMAQSKNGKVLELLEETYNQLSNLLQSMPSPTAPEVEQFGVVGALRRTVDDEMGGAFDEVGWRIETQAEAVTRALPPLIAEVIYSAVREGLRNAARYGRGGNSQSRLCLQIVMEIDDERLLRVTLEDNGVGFEDQYTRDTIMQQNIHEAGRGEKTDAQQEEGGRISEDTNAISRSAQGGSGQGLALYSTLVAVIGGTLTINSRPGQYTRLTLELPRVVWGK